MLRDDLEWALDEIIALSNDSWEDYSTASETVEDPELSKLFSELANQRRDMAESLKQHVRKLNAAPRDRDTNEGTAKRLLARIRSAFSQDERRAMLEECERAETKLAARISEALEMEMPEETRAVLTHFRSDVTAAIGRLAAVRTRLYP